MSKLQENTAFYLKYRPQDLTELVGQENVKKILTSAFQNGKLGHAYLLVGPRGTGKTSTARILAKMVNCEVSTATNAASDLKIPCNSCTNCKSITDGSNLDLIEIDAASNRGIDDIRLLRDKIKLTPSSLKKKVYIIDEVHMLTQEAFNALLKTLEEPPSHALFILATTDVQKIPQTILSRVQRLNFKLASAAELIEAFKKIISREGLKIDQEVLDLIIKQADGSFRDGIKILDQMSSLDKKITVQDVQSILRSSGFDELIVLVENLADQDAQEAIYNLSRQLVLGIEVKDITFSLMDCLRSLLLIKNNLGEVLVKPEMTEEKYNQLFKLKDRFSLTDLSKYLNILQEALVKLKSSPIQALPLELAIVEICQKEVNGLQLTVDSERESKEKIKVEGELNIEEPVHLPPSSLKELPSTVNPPSSGDDVLKLKEKWTFVLETVRPANFSLEALLRSVNIAECNEKTVVLEVPYSFHQRILEAPKNRDLLESILSEILGRAIRVATALGNRPQRREDIANIEVAADDEIIRAAAEIFNSEPIN